MAVASKLPASIAKTVPASPHRAPVSVQVSVITRPVRIPQLRARVRLAAVARIAFPSFVWRSRRCTPAITITDATMMPIWAPVSVMPPAWIVGPMPIE